MTEKTGRTTRMLQAALAAPNKPRPYVVGAHARHAEDLRHALARLLGADPAPWHPEIIPLSALDSGFDWRIMRRRGSNRPVFVDHYAWSAYFDGRVRAARLKKDDENRQPLRASERAGDYLIHTLEHAWWVTSILANGMDPPEEWARPGFVVSEIEAFSRWKRVSPLAPPPSRYRDEGDYEWRSDPGVLRVRANFLSMVVTWSPTAVAFDVRVSHPEYVYPNAKEWGFLLSIARRFARSTHPGYQWAGQALRRAIVAETGDLLDRLTALAIRSRVPSHPNQMQTRLDSLDAWTHAEAAALSACKDPRFLGEFRAMRLAKLDEQRGEP